jgi:hypothetical protein
MNFAVLLNFSDVTKSFILFSNKELNTTMMVFC